MAYKVLIVDDEEIVCRGLARFVNWQKYGFSVEGIACSVDEALTLMQRNSMDVVFMDIRMPGKTGLDLLQMIQKSYPDVKSVILSGFSEFSYAREAIRYGAVDYLNKPVDLKEVEELLERLNTDFLKEKQDRDVRNNRMEGLLLSAIKGYSKLEQEKYQLPVLEQWHGLSMEHLSRNLSEEEIMEKKELLRSQITAIVPDAYLLDCNVYELFAVIPCKNEAEADHFVDILEQTCHIGLEWACGISKLKHGIGALRDSYQEAERALHYHRASEKQAMIWYKNIEPLFSQNVPEVPEIIRDLVATLTNPEERSNAAPQLETALEHIYARNMTVMQFQTVCIRCLIELNGLLQGMKTEGIDLHGQLNKMLEKILLCDNERMTIDCMVGYVGMLAEGLNASDGQLLGGGVIKEVQLFIRRHFNENITLNMLADQFYLHPNYLSRLFKEKTGRNFVEYMTEVRMEKVKELLEDPEKKVSDISMMAGYDNPRYFSKVFKQFTGKTPSEYRDMLSGK